MPSGGWRSPFVLELLTLNYNECLVHPDSFQWVSLTLPSKAGWKQLNFCLEKAGKRQEWGQEVGWAEKPKKLPSSGFVWRTNCCFSWDHIPTEEMKKRCYKHSMRHPWVLPLPTEDLKGSNSLRLIIPFLIIFPFSFLCWDYDDCPSEWQPEVCALILNYSDL